MVQASSTTTIRQYHHHRFISHEAAQYNNTNEH